METRKLEFFRDGRVGYACGSRAAYGVELGLAPIPALSELNADPEFVGAMITAAEFDALGQRTSADATPTASGRLRKSGPAVTRGGRRTSRFGQKLTLVCAVQIVATCMSNPTALFQ